MKVLIVDDEILIRNWLSLLLCQIEGYNIEISEACDVPAALKIIEETHPDLIFTDIKMPNSNGIDLIKFLKETHPSIKTVVLSAYEDFDYVRLAMKNGALDYLLKPKLTIEDIKSILDKMQLLLNSASPPDPQKILQIKKNNEIYSAIISDNIDNNNLLKTFKYENLPQSQTLCILGFCLKKAIVQESPKIELCIDITRIMAAEKIEAYCSCPSNDMLVVFFVAPTNIPEYMKNELDKLSLLINNAVDLMSDNTVAYTINKTVKKPDLAATLLSCYQLLQNYSYYGAVSQNIENVYIAKTKIQESIRGIAQNLEAKLFNQAINNFLDIVRDAHNAMLPLKEVKGIVHNCFSLFFIYSDPKQYHQIDNKSQIHYVRSINNVTKRDEMDQIIKKFLDNYQLFINSMALPISEQVKRALEYIAQHYSEKITLNQLASFVYLNPSYFSQQFKKQTGVSFSDYLENTRIKNAKLLLKETNKSIMEISDELGFSSHNYFTTVFKKIVGISPLKYRSKNKN